MRADQLLVERGLAASRSQAQRLHRPASNRHPHQLCEAACLQPLHHPASVQVHGLDADAQLLGNLAVVQPLGQRYEDVSLTRRQAVDARLHQGQCLIALSRQGAFKGETLVFVHTGGAQGLFGYQTEIEGAL